ncbi:Mitochondrial ADP/ATP translocase, partial [Diplonema papillatum]
SLSRTVSHLKMEGFLSAWRGASPTIIRWLPSQYIVLFLKDYISAVIPSCKKQDGYGKYFANKVGSGAATGVINALIWAYPLDVVRQQLATKNTHTWRNAVSSVYNAHGLRGFYRGFMMDAPGLMIFRGVQLGGWDLVKDHYGSSWNEKTRVDRFMHGQVISLMGSVMSYPWDTVRRNLISCDQNGSYSEVYRSGVATAGGLRRFLYAGFSARVLSSVVNGALLEGFDEWKRTA